MLDIYQTTPLKVPPCIIKSREYFATRQYSNRQLNKDDLKMMAGGGGGDFNLKRSI